MSDEETSTNVEVLVSTNDSLTWLVYPNCFVSSAMGDLTLTETGDDTYCGKVKEGSWIAWRETAAIAPEQKAIDPNDAPAFYCTPVTRGGKIDLRHVLGGERGHFYMRRRPDGVIELQRRPFKEGRFVD